MNSKSFLDQIQELHIMIHDILAEDHSVNESFHFVAVIGKLLSVWKDFKQYLKHKCNEMSWRIWLCALQFGRETRGMKSVLALRLKILLKSRNKTRRS